MSKNYKLKFKISVKDQQKLWSQSMIQIRIFSLLILLSAPLFADFSSPFRSSVEGVSIPNAHQVMVNSYQAKIYRGNSPQTAEQVKELVSQNIKNILVFKNFYTPEDQEEVMDLYLENGFSKTQIVHIQMPWKNIKTLEQKKKTCRMIFQGLEVIRESKKDLFFHCTVGEDRTGLLAGLAHIALEGWSVRQAFEKEMCARGYEAGNPHKIEDSPQVVSAIRQNLTPLFLQIATIVKNQKDWSLESCNSLPEVDTDQILDGLRVDDFKCQPQPID